MLTHPSLLLTHPSLLLTHPSILLTHPSLLLTHPSLAHFVVSSPHMLALSIAPLILRSSRPPPPLPLLTLPLAPWPRGPLSQASSDDKPRFAKLFDGVDGSGARRQAAERALAERAADALDRGRRTTWDLAARRVAALLASPAAAEPAYYMQARGKGRSVCVGGGG